MASHQTKGNEKPFKEKVFFYMVPLSTRSPAVLAHCAVILSPHGGIVGGGGGGGGSGSVCVCACVCISARWA